MNSYNQHCICILIVLLKTKQYCLLLIIVISQGKSLSKETETLYLEIVQTLCNLKAISYMETRHFDSIFAYDKT